MPTTLLTFLFLLKATSGFWSFFHTENLPLNLATTTPLCSQKATEIEYIKLEGTECLPPIATSEVQMKLTLLTVLLTILTQSFLSTEA